MPTDDQQTRAAGPQELSMYEDNPASSHEDEDREMAPVSEVAARLTLLGKLIVPRMPR